MPAEIVAFHNLAMIAVSVLHVFLAATGLRIAPWEGAVLVGGYAVYVWLIWP